MKLIIVTTCMLILFAGLNAPKTYAAGPVAALNADTQVICGGTPPSGWITVAVNGTCRDSGKTLVSRTIQRIDMLPNGTTLNTCGDMPPGGWVTTAVSNSYCANIGTTFFIKRTIRRVDGMEVNYRQSVCGDPAPPGWITTEVSSTPCAKLGTASFIRRTIRRIDKLPTNALVDTCGACPRPAGSPRR